MADVAADDEDDCFITPLAGYTRSGQLIRTATDAEGEAWLRKLDKDFQEEFGVNAISFAPDAPALWPFNDECEIRWFRLWSQTISGEWFVTHREGVEMAKWLKARLDERDMGNTINARNAVNSRFEGWGWKGRSVLMNLLEGEEGSRDPEPMASWMASEADVTATDGCELGEKVARCPRPRSHRRLGYGRACAASPPSSSICPRACLQSAQF